MLHQQPDLFPETLYLRRIDEDRNMRRYYRLYLDRDLFGQWQLVLSWGRIGSGGRELRETHDSFGPALDALAKWEKVKTRRGYSKT